MDAGLNRSTKKESLKGEVYSRNPDAGFSYTVHLHCKELRLGAKVKIRRRADGHLATLLSFFSSWQVFVM